MNMVALIGQVSLEQLQDISSKLWKKDTKDTTAEFEVVGTIKAFKENSVGCFSPNRSTFILFLLI